MTRSKPDILRDTETTDMINVLEKNKNTIPAMVEDPVRRTYKKILAVTFITTSTLYILVDLSFQVTLEVNVWVSNFSFVPDTICSNLQFPHLLKLHPQL
jgi:hypothetical protein